MVAVVPKFGINLERGVTMIYTAAIVLKVTWVYAIKNVTGGRRYRALTCVNTNNIKNADTSLALDLRLAFESEECNVRGMQGQRNRNRLTK